MTPKLRPKRESSTVFCIRKKKKIEPSSKEKCNFRKLDEAVMVNFEHKDRRRPWNN